MNLCFNLYLKYPECKSFIFRQILLDKLFLVMLRRDCDSYCVNRVIFDTNTAGDIKMCNLYFSKPGGFQPDKIILLHTYSCRITTIFCLVLTRVKFHQRNLLNIIKITL